MPKLLHYWVLKNKTKKDFVWYIFGTEPTYLLFLDSVRMLCEGENISFSPSPCKIDLGTLTGHEELIKGLCIC